MGKGLFHIYYGNGKGKTTACTGLAIRMAGSGGKVLYSFMQKGVKSSEVRLMEKLENIDVLQVCKMTKFTFLMDEKERAEYNRQHREGLDEIIEKAGAGKYDLVVVDEMLGAIKEGAVDIDAVLKFVKNENRAYELVFSGREAPDLLVELADYASRIEEVRHPYTKGIKGRKGIEF
ncbi:MAG: cob(I)yrinic acid a,c-diamide adenosyltransferase [Clostridia bacterium]|nr:cob(I)yrinic acid a,c-diamide adenosyltransferase [Clostridia bacterium]MBN2884131.1 cob(I)yrinic acid a,c-diamide adenosyltransferase [Clostridia bacterium]